ncbi:hypothetical protein MN608_04811 [Microdochium nivale]|nr:hypothetical protein MN608_04811 [Microdochium nivale]
MPPRTPQCCQALHRTSQSQRGRFGIPDAILGALFEHYSATAKAQVRHGSYVPGPFENRRRNGNRRMGELRLGQTSGSAAPWQLENVPDLTQWRWSPPSSAAGRISQHLRNGHRSLLKTVFASSLHPLQTLWAAVSAMICSVVPSIYKAGATPLDFVELGFAHISQDLARDPSLQRTPRFLKFCHHLGQALATGHLKSSDAALVFSNLHQGLSTLASEQLCGIDVLERTQCLILVLIEEIVGGIATNAHAAFDTQLFSSLLLAVSGMPQRNTTSVLTTLMACIRVQCISSLSHEIHAVLETCFFSVFTSTESMDVLMAQVDQLAGAWSGLNSSQHFAILNMATQTTLDYLHLGTADFERVRLAWLGLLARLPEIGTEYLAKACAFTEAGSRTPPLSGNAIYQILLAQLDRQGLLPDSEYAAQMLQLQYSHDLGPFASLGFYLGERSDIANVSRVAEFLTLAGRSHNVLQLLHGVERAARAGGNAVNRDNMPLINLAFACESPAIIVEVLKHYIRNPSERVEDFWRSNAAIRSLSSMIAVRNVKKAKIFSSLQLNKPPLGRCVPVGKLKPDFQVQKAICLAQAAVANAAKSPRRAFGIVFHCVNYLRKYYEVVPISMLRCVHELVKMDLVAGRLGVQIRLKWYLDLVGMKFGPEIQMQTGEALQRWREHNRELARHQRLRVRD